MATVVVAGNALVIKSGLLFEEIERVEKYRPRALIVFEDDAEVFKLKTGASQSVSKFGICFASKDDSGFAQATVVIPEDITGNEAKERYVLDTYGKVINSLSILEETVKTDIEEIKAFEQAVKSTITIV